MNKGSQLNKESGVSNEQRVPAEKVSKEKGSQVNKESGDSNEQGVSAEQGVRGLK